jgi:hypothetical protein
MQRRKLTSRNTASQAGDLVQSVLGAGLDLGLAAGFAQACLLGGAGRGSLGLWRH